jgi:signal peptidase I
MEEVTTLVAPEVPFAAQAVPRKTRKRLGFRLNPFWDAITKALLVFIIAQTWIVQGYRVYGSCMEPNLSTGERLLGSKLSLASGIHRGDVVVFQPPETIEIKNNRVHVNGRTLNEPYLGLTWHDERPAERVPDDMVYVLGDNRDNSNDSRVWGELPIQSIQAKAWFRYWPPERVGFIAPATVARDPRRRRSAFSRSPAAVGSPPART